MRTDECNAGRKTEDDGISTEDGDNDAREEGCHRKGPRNSRRNPVFKGTRVRLQNLFDCLEGGETLEQFLEGFPSVSREMAIAALEEARELLSARA